MPLPLRGPIPPTHTFPPTPTPHPHPPTDTHIQHSTRSAHRVLLVVLGVVVLAVLHSLPRALQGLRDGLLAHRLGEVEPLLRGQQGRGSGRMADEGGRLAARFLCRCRCAPRRPPFCALGKGQPALRFERLLRSSLPLATPPPPRTRPMASDTSSVANSHERRGKEMLKLMRSSSPWAERSTTMSVRVWVDR
jgi:hypothetical protein